MDLSAQPATGRLDDTQVTKESDRSIVVKRSFRATPRQVCDALTKQDQVPSWFRPARMRLMRYDADFRNGGTSRYVFERSGGKRLELRHTYREIAPPHRWDHVETYDFSPLELSVTTVLEEDGGKTIFTQTIRYAAQQERDDDFATVSESAAEIYRKFDDYLKSR